jgi:hypothetical protein
MTLPVLNRSSGWRAVLLLFAIAACCTMPTNFQREANSLQRNLLNEARKSIPSLAPDTIIIGYLANPRGGKNFTYVPSEVRVPKGQRTAVSWISWDGKFTLNFGRRSPLEGGREQITSEPASGTELSSAAANVLAMDPGYYHYKVTLYGSDGKTVILEDKECPPIIVE